MKVRPESVPGAPREVDMEPDSLWRWRIVVIGDGWTSEHWFRGPRWLAKRHVRRSFHKLRGE